MSAVVKEEEMNYMLVLSTQHIEADSPNEFCEVYWGTKSDMEEMYREVMESESDYTNIILCRMVNEAQLQYTEIEYGDEE